MSGGRVLKYYSIAFKQKVVSEIESGKLSIGSARRIYDIGGTSTIQGWIRRLGKDHLLNKVVRIQMKDEKDKLKELEKKRRELESALSEAHLKIRSLETLLDIASEHYGTDIKKNFATKASKS